MSESLFIDYHQNKKGRVSGLYDTKKASCVKQIAEQRFRPNKRNHQSGSSVCAGIVSPQNIHILWGPLLDHIDFRQINCRKSGAVLTAA